MAEEADVGILCYITDVPGFRGILKHRYTDFIVNEVDCEGKVVRLTCLDVPEEEIELSQKTLMDEVNNEEVDRHCGRLNSETYNAEIQEFKNLAGEIDAENLKYLIDKLSAGNFDDLTPIILSPDPDKLHRGEVHNFFKRKLSFLVTDTIDGTEPNSKCIRVRYLCNNEQERGRNDATQSDHKRKNKSGNLRRNAKRRRQNIDLSVDSGHMFDSRGADSWPDGKKFLRFHLYKENKDTHEALNVIGKMLGLRPKSFGIAGTKDKRAVTTQRVTVFKQRASRVAALNKRLFGIKLGDFSYVNEGLALGQLSGNRFNITLRGVTVENKNIIKDAADGLGKNGFVNYFGLQRFGSGTVPTHMIGAALLQGEWKAAVDLILDPRDGERGEIIEAREYYKNTGDIDGTLKRLPRHMMAEKSILTGLKRSPGNYLQAMFSIPRNLRLMYVHSYQSYLWNHAATARVKKYGVNSVVEGDLVYSKEVGSDASLGQDNELNNCEAADDFESLDEDAECDYIQENYANVKIVRSADIAAGTYTIEDVLLPLPGSRVVYPANEVAEVYHDMAKRDCVNLTDSSHNVKDYSITSIPGGYRRLIQKPIDFTWKVLRYKDPAEPLAETDLDMITKTQDGESFRQQASSVATLKDCEERPTIETVHAEDDELKEDMEKLDTDASELQTALQLAFTLPTSSYATMAIRELLKTSTSTAYHKKLSE